MEYKKYTFTSQIQSAHNNLWGYHFSVPDDVAEQLAAYFKDPKARRVVCLLNGTLEYQCSLLPQKNAPFVISVNRKTADTLRLQEGTQITAEVWNDTSEYGLPMPEEFAELLAQDDEGNQLFHALTKGKQRTLLYLVGSVKSSNIRIFRALKIVEHLKMAGGEINYKQLNVSMKTALTHVPHGRE
jgi:hypothetical protein